MSTPVVVSRIQNRRGTQTQFDGYAYNPSGPNSVYPKNYTGVGGYIDNGGTFPDFTISNYPNVLLPGEIALCTDSRRMFVGNLNGEYLEIKISLGEGILLKPSKWVLPPSATFTNITQAISGPTISLEYSATPFFSILYDITDSLSLDWNTVGTTFSKNGELRITATADFAPIPNPAGPLFPDITSVTLTDVGTDINLVSPADIYFMAQYNGTNIELLYKHDFAYPLTFSTSSIAWVPFI